MYRNQAAVIGTSAYDLERIGALPGIPEIEEDSPRRGTHEVMTPPGEETKKRVKARAKARARARQGISVFAVFGFIAVLTMLTMVILSHMQLAVISAEIAQLEGQIGTLQEESARLQVAYGHAFSQVEIERFAREELGMMEALRGQVLSPGTRGDTAEILVLETAGEQGLLGRLAGFFSSLMEYLPFFS